MTDDCLIQMAATAGMMKTTMILYFLLTSVSGLANSFTCPDSVKRLCQCRTIYHIHHIREERNYVDCSSRNLKNIPTLDFNDGTRIYNLALHNNSFTSMPSHIFPRKLRVTRLDISDNPFGSSLQDGLLKVSLIGLKVLIARTIDLNLQEDTSLSFIKGLTSLHELDLTRNYKYSIKMLPSLFADNEIHYLRILSLAYCRIVDVNAHAFIGLTNLRTLDLSGNFLKKVPHALHRLALLRRLNLRNNEITYIYHGDFNELHCLEELDLSVNLLGQLEPFKPGAFFGIGNSLLRLKLFDSHLPFIPTTALAELKKLKDLDISYNKIAFMSNRSFVGEYELETLDLSGNPWVMLIDDQMFQGVQDSLVKLRMRDFGLPVLPTAPLARLKRLQELDVSYNALKSIQNDSLNGLAARILKFRGNKIKFISDSAFDHYRLPIVLDLAENDLHSLDFVFNSNKCLFFRLNITQNGFLCDCQIEKLMNSRRVEHLTGSCNLKDGSAVSFSNSSMKTGLELGCGKTKAMSCLWWVGVSSSTQPHTLGTTSNIFVIYVWMMSSTFLTT